MEVSAIVDMFRRSVAKRKARYIEYLGHGDSKSINGVNEDQPYGPDLKVGNWSVSTMCQRECMLALKL